MRLNDDNKHIFSQWNYAHIPLKTVFEWLPRRFSRALRESWLTPGGIEGDKPVDTMSHEEGIVTADGPNADLNDDDMDDGGLCSTTGSETKE